MRVFSTQNSSNYLHLFLSCNEEPFTTLEPYICFAGKPTTPELSQFLSILIIEHDQAKPFSKQKKCCFVREVLRACLLYLVLLHKCSNILKSQTQSIILSFVIKNFRRQFHLYLQLLLLAIYIEIQLILEELNICFSNLIVNYVTSFYPFKILPRKLKALSSFRSITSYFSVHFIFTLSSTEFFLKMCIFGISKFTIQCSQIQNYFQYLK